MKLTRIFKDFFESEKSGGLTLVACTILSLLLANSAFSEYYKHLWHIELQGYSIEHWINEGLMTIFFLLIGLELEREIYIGELSKIKDALLPIFAAIGGMLVPAGIYMFFNWGTTTQSGAGIPMATDIAFALGILSLLGKKVPFSLKIFLTALAIADDLGSIFVIVLFYSKGLYIINLIISLGIFVFLYILGRLKVYNLIPYLVGGVVMWYFMLHSGVHATITGVLLAFAIPFGEGGDDSTSHILQHFLHKPVAYLILPIFALANTAIVIGPDIMSVFLQNYNLGILLGLLIGKPVGILLFSFLAVSFGICKLPSDVNWKAISGLGFLGGIGFTMSIFIAILALNEEVIVNSAKFTILFASLIAGTVGYFVLKIVLKKDIKEEN
jgi:NhaA family Na+:H+ antiporter